MIKYEETCQVTCVDNGQVAQADVLDFKPQLLLSVSLQKSIKVILKYHAKSGEYQGDMFGRTFTSNGPKGKQYTTGR